MTPLSPNSLTLRIEALVLGALCILAYSMVGGSWGLFALLILSPDVAMLGYLAGNRIGAICYNIAHSTIGPLVLGAIGVQAGADTALHLALIWGAHIGLDRAMGYGLKYAAGFKATHLARV